MSLMRHYRIAACIGMLHRRCEPFPLPKMERKEVIRWLKLCPVVNKHFSHTMKTQGSETLWKDGCRQSFIIRYLGVCPISSTLRSRPIVCGLKTAPTSKLTAERYMLTAPSVVIQKRAIRGGKPVTVTVHSSRHEEGSCGMRDNSNAML
jgi:hypothetical protein